MNAPTLESLAARVAELERQLAEAKTAQPKKDWRTIVGMFEDDDCTRRWVAEMEATREAERRAAREAVEERLP